MVNLKIFLRTHVVLISCICMVISFNLSMKDFVSFPGCKKNMAGGSDVISTSKTRSSLDCLTRCARNADCLAVNACEESSGAHCELLGSRNTGCSDLVNRSDCRYKEKKAEDHNPCQNGATWVYNEPCLCTPGWAGYYCERLVRDCKEGKKSGLQGETISKIQPIQCPFAFDAYCNNWGYTYFLRRNHPFDDPAECEGKVLDPNMTWAGYREQFGSRKCDYCVGLEKLWQILRQGSYNLHLYLQYYSNPQDQNPTTVEVYYWNFMMASEADDYAIVYTGVWAKNGAEDGLNLGTNKPTRFCTWDRDCGTCAKDKGVAWWYNEDCDNFPLTARNGTVYWPINGTVRRLSLAVMQFSPDYYHW